MSAAAKRVVVWGTGFVGKMVIPEIVPPPRVRAGGRRREQPRQGRAGTSARSAASIRSASTATDDLDALVALRPDALVHYGPTAAHADDNIRDIGAFLRAGIDVCSTAMTPWVWPAMSLRTRPTGSTPITEACEAGGSSCFTTGIDPGFANDLFPMTLMGLCGEVRLVRALEILDYINYEGDYEDEMGIGRPPEFMPLLEHTDILVMAWGATVPMMAHAVGIELDEITTTWEKWVTDAPITTAKGVINPGEVAAIHFTINGIYHGETRIQLEHVNRVGTDAAPDWPRGNQDDVYRVEIEGTPSITQETAFRFTDGSGRDAAAAGLPGHRPAGAQRRAGGQRPARRVGHRPRPAADPRRRHHPIGRRPSRQPPQSEPSPDTGAAMTPDDLVEIELIKRLKYKLPAVPRPEALGRDRDVLHPRGHGPLRRRALRVRGSGRHHGLPPHLDGYHHHALEPPLPPSRDRPDRPRRRPPGCGRWRTWSSSPTSSSTSRGRRSTPTAT